MDNKMGREWAASQARSLRLGKTMTQIQDGASADDIWNIAFSEHMGMHSNCPCCRGSQAVAKLIADHIQNQLRKC